jgi:hypothetical protein
MLLGTMPCLMLMCWCWCAAVALQVEFADVLLSEQDIGHWQEQDVGHWQDVYKWLSRVVWHVQIEHMLLGTMYMFDVDVLVLVCYCCLAGRVR